jgi:hypothetical protein
MNRFARKHAKVENTDFNYSSIFSFLLWGERPGGALVFNGTLIRVLGKRVRREDPDQTA